MDLRELKNDELQYKYEQFMQKCKRNQDDSKQCTHTLMGPLSNTRLYRGSFCIINNDYEEFMKIYTELIRRDLFKLHIIERHNDISILFIDIDFKYMNNKRQYTEKHIKNIIEKINKLIYEYIKINKNEIIAYILEKKEVDYDKEKKIYVDGFHIMYPDIPMDKEKRMVIFNELKKYIDNNNI